MQSHVAEKLTFSPERVNQGCLGEEGQNVPCAVTLDNKLNYDLPSAQKLTIFTLLRQYWKWILAAVVALCAGCYLLRIVVVCALRLALFRVTRREVEAPREDIEALIQLCPQAQE